MLRSLLIGASSALLLTALALLYGPQIGRALLPAIEHSFALLAPEFAVRSVRLLQADNQWLFRADLLTGPYAFVAGRALPANLDLYASTLLGHALLHPVLLLSAVAGWPGLAPWARSKALLSGLVLLIPIEILDVPMVLLGSVWDLLYANFAPGQRPLLGWWMNFMNGGGRLALPLSAAGAAIVIAQGLP